MQSLKAKPGSGCAVETKVIGRYSPQHSDWHVHCGPKMRIFSVLASPCGLQIESRFLVHTDRKSTRLNSSHGYISYAVFCLKKKKSNYYSVERDLGIFRISSRCRVVHQYSRCKHTLSASTCFLSSLISLIAIGPRQLARSIS